MLVRPVMMYKCPSRNQQDENIGRMNPKSNEYVAFWKLLLFALINIYRTIHSADEGRFESLLEMMYITQKKIIIGKPHISYYFN